VAASPSPRDVQCRFSYVHVFVEWYRTLNLWSVLYMNLRYCTCRYVTSRCNAFTIRTIVYSKRWMCFRLCLSPHIYPHITENRSSSRIIVRGSDTWQSIPLNETVPRGWVALRVWWELSRSWYLKSKLHWFFVTVNRLYNSSPNYKTTLKLNVT